MKFIAIAFTLCAAVSPVLHGQELLERTLAIVGGQVVTLTDVKTALALGLVSGSGADAEREATERLIDRALVLREVQRYSPPEPAPEAIASRLAVARDRFASDEDFARALTAGGFTPERLEMWVRDDLRITAYLDQRFAAAGTPTDQEVAAYYATHREEFERGGLSYDTAAGLIRQRLSGERRSELITDWISDLRRRTSVVRLPG